MKIIKDIKDKEERIRAEEEKRLKEAEMESAEVADILGDD